MFVMLSPSGQRKLEFLRVGGRCHSGGFRLERHVLKRADSRKRV